MAERQKHNAPPAFLAAARVRNARWHFLPKCSATAKRSGQPCQLPAMANGKCYYHGGKTPKGKDWHRISKPKNPSKATDKLDAIERRNKARARRLARMTPEERAAHKKWHQSHAPGPPEPREARRQLRKQNADMRARAAADRAPEPSPEMQALLARKEALEARLAALSAEPRSEGGCSPAPDEPGMTDDPENPETWRIFQ